MDRKELEKQIIELVAMCYGKNADDLTVDTRFAEDLAGAGVGKAWRVENGALWEA